MNTFDKTTMFERVLNPITPEPSAEFFADSKRIVMAEFLATRKPTQSWSIFDWVRHHAFGTTVSVALCGFLLFLSLPIQQQPMSEFDTITFALEEL